MFLKDDHIDYKWLWFFGIIMILIGISLDIGKIDIWVFGVTTILMVFLLEIIEKKAQEKRKKIEEREVAAFMPVKLTLGETQRRIKINPDNWSPWIIAPPGKHCINLSFPSWAKIMYCWSGTEEELGKNTLVYTDIPHRVFRFRGEGEIEMTIKRQNEDVIY